MNSRNGLTTIGAIADNAVANIGQPQAEYISGGSPAGEQLVNKVCQKLEYSTKGYRKKVGGQAGEAAYKQEMMLAFAENGIGSLEQCLGAFAYFHAEDCWCPSIGELVTIIQRHELGEIPNYKDAYLEYCRNYANPKHNWSHPIVIETVRQGGIGFDMKALTADKALPMYERCYQILLRKLKAGEDINSPIARAIPEKISRPCTKEESKSRLASMRGSIGI